jgi:hypothetical protein
MKFIKLFENFEESEFETILYGSDAKLTLEVGYGTPIEDIDLIEDISKDYKRTYIKNKEWGGGPVNDEWRKRWSKQFGVKELSKKIWPPSLNLNIDLKDFGRITFGFYLKDGKISTFGANLNSENFDSKKEESEFRSFLSRIFNSKITFDQFDSKYNFNILNLKDRDMDITYVKENNEKDYNDLLNSLKDLSKSLNHLSTLQRQHDDHEERRKILNTDHDIIKKVKNLGDIRYWDPLLSSDDGLSRNYKDYFSYFTDYDWKLDITPSQFFIQIELRKSFKDTIDAESLFNEINKNCENINRAIELDGFKTLYQIKFNKTAQSDNNPITHKNDLFRYKGFEKITEPRYTGDKMVGRIPVYITFTII